MIFYEDPEEEKGSLRMRIFRHLLLGWAMFIAIFGVGVVSLLILFPPVEALYFSITGNGCGNEIPHNATIDVGDASLIRVASNRGDLSVEGQPGLTTVQVQGRACASAESKRHLESIIFTTSRIAGEIVVAAVIPRQGSGKLVEGVRVDLEIHVPENFPRVEINTEIGQVTVSGVDELQVVVGFGILNANKISGNVIVSSLEGSMKLIDIEGDVTVDSIHGSGEVNLAGIGGDVMIGNNRSGPASISNVGGDVTIGSAGSGRLTVKDVAGNLLVGSNSRGRIEIEQIQGSIDIPEDQEQSGA